MGTSRMDTGRGQGTGDRGPGWELCPEALRQLQQLFTECQGELRRHLWRALRGVTCPATRDDREGVFWARCWQSFLSRARQGKPIIPILHSIGHRAALSALSQRSFSGGSNLRDPLSSRCQVKGRATVVFIHSALSDTLAQHRCPTASQRARDTEEGPLSDNGRHDPAERAALRIDMADWLAGLGEQHRAAAELLSTGEGTGDVARKIGRSHGRVSQIRGELMDSWSKFQE